jgi:hypothetical protein
MKLIMIALTTAAAFAQKRESWPSTDAEKTGDALRAGPPFITKDATLVDWPSAPGGEYRVLRKGSSECASGSPRLFSRRARLLRSCLPSMVQDSLTGRKPRIDCIEWPTCMVART